MLALEGYRLIDLSRLLPGPVASWMLADMGMEVIKVEELSSRAGMGRDSFTPADPTPDQEIRASAFNTVARNKKSVAVDLRQPKGLEIFYRLVETADVILEGYRPGVSKRLKFDYETIHRINPKIVYCSISAYGQDGPYATLPGHDPNYCAIAGQLAVTSDWIGNPVPNMIPIADIPSGLHAVIGILAALMARQKTGVGQFIDVSLTHSVMPFLVAILGQYFRDGQIPKRGAPNMTVMKCKDGRFITTANVETHFWERFCKAIGCPEFIPMWRPVPDNTVQYKKMVAKVRRKMLTRTRDDWFRILRAADTCVAPLLEIDEIFADPQNVHREMALHINHPLIGEVQQLGFPIHFSSTACQFRNFAPLLGEHTDMTLHELGYTQNEIQELENSRIIKRWH